MSETGFVPAPEVRGFRRFRYLLDVCALLAATLLLQLLVEALVHVPTRLETGLVFDAIGNVLLVGVGCGLVRFRGESIAAVGLKTPQRWSHALVTGIGLAALVFLAIYFLEKAGFRRNLSRFQTVEGNLILTIIGVVYAFIGAGFYEEFIFRGFLMQAVAMFLGGRRWSWVTACILQGVLFGLLHAYQNPIGVVIAGTLGMMLGVLVLVCGNLWPAIIGHGLYDASRFVLFYFQGPPHA